jgi:hypothetical protein
MEDLNVREMNELHGDMSTSDGVEPWHMSAIPQIIDKSCLTFSPGLNNVKMRWI